MFLIISIMRTNTECFTPLVIGFKASMILVSLVSGKTQAFEAL